MSSLKKIEKGISDLLHKKMFRLYQDNSTQKDATDYFKRLKKIQIFLWLESSLFKRNNVLISKKTNIFLQSSDTNIDFSIDVYMYVYMNE